ncbi:hypothetical protein RhiirC2_786239 [Rhizophagus irregularis]|uniref:Uncharacterized protein n=1 Tax=Rhizophagus irregularis TaxID=588596 RepID=A0A2N1MUU3_9GLOM|nr:hypothetical protein RhiirC2_786239 [Rhizophagus irregularis]
MAEENEFYSKLCVAEIFRGAVDEKSEEIDLLGGDKFSYNLATILARDREVVAINLRVLSDGCELCPMKFKQACGREDMRDLILTILEYCSEKFRYIFNKLRRDITKYEDKVYTKSFLDYVKTKINDVDIFDNVDVFDNVKKFNISSVCYSTNTYFSRIDLKLLNPDVVNYHGMVLSKNFLIMKKNMKVSSFMEVFLKDPMIGYKLLERMYGGVDSELNCV